MKLRYLAFGGRDEDGSEGETGTRGIQITSCETNISQASVMHTTQENVEKKMRTFKRLEEEEEEPFFFEEQKDYRSLPEPLMF